MIHVLTDIAVHAGVGGVFMGTGACVRGLCEHRHHRWLAGGALLLVESAIAVALVG